MKRNEGFSLVELIVVIAIMALFTVGVVSVVLSQSDYQCRKAADQIDSALSETRSQALAKTGAWMELTYDSADGYVLRTSYAGDVVLGTSCVVTFTDEGSSSPEDVQATPLILSYSRGSGAFQHRIASVSTNTVDDGSTIPVYTYAGSAYCEKIVVSNAGGGGHTYELTLDHETGKHQYERK